MSVEASFLNGMSPLQGGHQLSNGSCRAIGSSTNVSSSGSESTTSLAATTRKLTVYPCPRCSALLSLQEISLHIALCVIERRRAVRSSLQEKFPDVHANKCLDLIEPSASFVMGGAACIIQNELFLGAAVAARDVPWLVRNDIKAVLTVARELEVPEDAFEQLGIQWTRILADDVCSAAGDLRAQFDAAYEFILDAPKPVLVHCAAGVSRSATIVVAYLMRRLHWNLFEALSHVRMCRPVVYPNKGFFAALMRYDTQLHGMASIPPEMLELHESPETVIVQDLPDPLQACTT